MYQEERMLSILKYLKQYRRISVQELCDWFNISRDTARRDLVRLEEQGAILRTRGGAILPGLVKEVKGYRERLVAESNEKREIGQMAASLIRDGDYLIMDASTTVQFAAQSLEEQHVMVVTNSIDIAAILSDKELVEVHMLGGRLHKKHRYVTGGTPLEKLKDIRVDKAFLGTCGLNPEGLFHPDAEDAQLVREMVNCADQVILLADATKFNKRLFYRVCGLEKVDRIVTDQEPGAELMQVLREKKVDVMVKGRRQHDQTDSE